MVYPTCPFDSVSDLKVALATVCYGSRSICWHLLFRARSNISSQEMTTPGAGDRRSRRSSSIGGEDDDEDPDSPLPPSKRYRNASTKTRIACFPMVQVRHVISTCQPCGGRFRFYKLGFRASICLHLTYRCAPVMKCASDLKYICDTPLVLTSQAEIHRPSVHHGRRGRFILALLSVGYSKPTVSGASCMYYTGDKRTRLDDSSPRNCVFLLFHTTGSFRLLIYLSISSS